MDKSALINQMQVIAKLCEQTADAAALFPQSVRFGALASAVIDCPPLLDAIKAKVVGDSMLSIKITCDAGEAVESVKKIIGTAPISGPLEVGTLIHEAIQAGLAGDPVERALRSAPGYEQLVEVFTAAHDQAAYGKGKERHANDLPFHEQRMQTISDLVGSPDGMVYQVTKKMTEGLQFDNPQKREHELLGAINYLAGIVIWLRRHETIADQERV